MRKLKGPLILLLTSIIWGSTFVAQSMGMETIGPFSYNAARFLVGLLVLTPLVIYSIIKAKKTKNEYKKYILQSYKCGMIIGVFTGLASNFQQHSLLTVSASKAGFLTALYIIFVPIIGLAFRKKPKSNVIFAAILAMIGFYLLSVKGDFTIEKADYELIACAILYSIQITLIDVYAKDYDSIIISQAQIIPSLIISIIAIFVFKEKFSMTDVNNSLIPILYAGVLSLGVAYTLQIIGQKYTDPTAATIIMSLESVFAAISGYLFQHDILTSRELIGCVIIFVAVILSQIEFKKKSSE